IRVEGDRFPEVGHPRQAAGRLDLVVDLLHLARGFFFGNVAGQRHCSPLLVVQSHIRPTTWHPWPESPGQGCHLARHLDCPHVTGSAGAPPTSAARARSSISRKPLRGGEKMSRATQG